MDGKPLGSQTKKLEEAARYWVGGGDSLKEVIQDLKNLNAPAEVIKEFEDAQRTEDFEVWPENWTVLEIFLRLQTQWRTTFGGLLGLDYTAAKWVFEIYEVKDQKEMLDSLMIIERAALTALNEDKNGS